MLFSFLKYIRPIWYFNLKPEKDFNYFPLVNKNLAIDIGITEDNRYLSNTSKKYDLAWSAFQVGYIDFELKRSIHKWETVKLPVFDEYCFLRKNFHKAWALYVLILRVFTLKNPFIEINSYVKTRRVSREEYSKKSIDLLTYNQFSSDLVKNNPLVSIIIPTLNRYKYLKDVFKDLEKQNYRNFEVLVVDQTDDFNEEVYKGWSFDIKYWQQKEKALWRARNEAILASKGNYILLYDDDSLVKEDWIFQHLKALDFFKADISSGVSISVIGAKVPKHYSYFRWSDQLDTGNVLLKKEVFKKTGLFDRQFEKQRMGDGEFGLRAYLAGFRNISNPKAKRIHLKVKAGGLRQMGSWDGWRPKKLFAPRPIPSVLYYTRKYYGNKNSIYFILKSIAPSIIPIKYKSNKLFMLIVFVLMPVILPFILIQVILSWKASSQKLKQGAIINSFK